MEFRKQALVYIFLLLNFVWTSALFLHSTTINWIEVQFEETDLITASDQSTLWPYPGAPSLRFADRAPENPDAPRDFEIGFYRYGPTWYTKHYIVEFWLGSGAGGIFSVAGNNNGGGEIQVRNPEDTDSIQLNFYDSEHPVITTESGIALNFAAEDGLISRDRHTFADGIAISRGSGYAGQIMDGWAGNRVYVPTSAVLTHSLIFITPLSPAEGNWWVADILPNEGFYLQSTSDVETLRFNWWLLDQT